jgi:hypothetical protein
MLEEQQHDLLAVSDVKRDVTEDAREQYEISNKNGSSKPRICRIDRYVYETPNHKLYASRYKPFLLPGLDGHSSTSSAISAKC